MKRTKISARAPLVIPFMLTFALVAPTTAWADPVVGQLCVGILGMTDEPLNLQCPQGAGVSGSCRFVLASSNTGVLTLNPSYFIVPENSSVTDQVTLLGGSVGTVQIYLTDVNHNQTSVLGTIQVINCPGL